MRNACGIGTLRNRCRCWLQYLHAATMLCLPSPPPSQRGSRCSAVHASEPAPPIGRSQYQHRPPCFAAASARCRAILEVIFTSRSGRRTVRQLQSGCAARPLPASLSRGVPRTRTTPLRRHPAVILRRYTDMPAQAIARTPRVFASRSCDHILPTPRSALATPFRGSGLETSSRTLSHSACLQYVS
jgi:hypothetical protein